MGEQVSNNITRYNPTDVNDLMRLGAVLAQSGMFADARQEAQAVVKILAGAEMGFGAISAMTGIHVIQGRVTVGANLMAAAVKKSGKYDYRVTEHSEKECGIEFFQNVGGKMESLGVSWFTIEDARRAGTKNLDKYARNMLFARAMSNGVRWYCPDALGGAPVYTPEEMGADTDEEGNIVQAAAAVVEQPAPFDGRYPVEPAGRISDTQRAAIRELSKELWGETFEKEGARYVHRVYGTILASLTDTEGERLIADLKRKVAEKDKQPT
jgi:hypothetical protein